MTGRSISLVKSWFTQDNIDSKSKHFVRLDDYLTGLGKGSPKRILDIGCGLAREAGMFQKKYSTELYLLDGGISTNGPNQKRQDHYGVVDTFPFYASIDTLRASWDERQMKYTFVNAADPVIPDGLIFDVVFSFKSCGFHYPIETYLDLILDHTDNDSVVIMDIRIPSGKGLHRDMIRYPFIQVLSTEQLSERVHINLKKGRVKI